MKPDRPITELLSSGKPLLSVEFFPPKNDEGGAQLLRTAEALRPYHPDFVSITYGAGGTTRERTFQYAKILREDFGWRVMPHLTCVGSTKGELLDIVAGYHADGIRNIMALRGDPPKGQTEFVPCPDGLRYASDLVALIRENFPDICLGAGAYPEKHPEAASMEEDLAHLKIKADAGASFLTTQLFFDNDHYYKFLGACRARGIDLPVIPGVLPALSLAQVKRFGPMCGSSLPPALVEQLQVVEDDARAAEAVGITWAYHQIRELLRHGAPGIHLYILNRSSSAITLARSLERQPS
ncbi:MAG: methylenetetrahydrofolate reductase [NAD(P)H] [Chthoniobacterales bacterium]|nr:methylenetetrahydrofolate reductase [NAD(P)H] [Chthoniobacterales bacterium]